MDKTMVELFAGVGGFRLGLDRLEENWQTNWFSQWEPGKTKQWAHDCYVYHFGDAPDVNGNYTTGISISDVDKFSVPDHTLLCGGFPCQDYSVAHSLSSSRGIEGKKGVLWWDIRDMLIAKRPPFVLLENVDRLLKSPASQRGRDFGIILTSFAQLGYRVEWRVINAAEYGAVQRRRRTFIFAYNRKTEYANRMRDINPMEIIFEKGMMSQAFPIETVGTESEIGIPATDVSEVDRHVLYKDGIEESDNDLLYVSQNFAFRFGNAGFMRDGIVTTVDVVPVKEEPLLMSDIVQCRVDENFYIPMEDMASWTYMKGAKRIPRTSASGHEYIFSEGPIAFPDPLDRPARTMLTSEGTKNRSTHVIADPATGRLRLLTPIETERIQGFDDDWTKICLVDGKETEMPSRMRRFCMGNALVVQMVTRMGRVINRIVKDEP